MDTGTLRSSLWEVAIDGTSLHRLLDGWNRVPAECCGRWSPDGRWYVFQSTRDGRSDIWALPEPSGLIDGKPQVFRDFLLDAPAMFCELGERLGAVSHIVSFWNFRFPKGQPSAISAPELADILSDFEDSLRFVKREPSPYLLAS